MRATLFVTFVAAVGWAQPRIVNVHEHIQSLAEAETLVAAMDANGIRTTVLMGSSWFTFTLRQNVGFTRWQKNNDALLAIVEAWPGRFEAWPTVDPRDPNAVEILRRLMDRGATGVKLYAGHGLENQRRGRGPYFFHTMPLDDPALLPLYAWLQDAALPVCFHVNPGPKTPGFAEEFAAVLTSFPDLKVNAPHFVLSSIKSSRLEQLLRAFPNLVTDMSFGHDSFLIPGLKRISRNPKKFKRLLRKYPTRFLFGTDVVVTPYAHKTADWIGVRMKAYLDMLSKETYTTPLVKGALRGLGLEGAALRRVLWENYYAFVSSRPRGTKTGRIDWPKMGIPLTRDPPGLFVAP